MRNGDSQHNSRVFGYSDHIVVPLTETRGGGSVLKEQEGFTLGINEDIDAYLHLLIQSFSAFSYLESFNDK